MSNDYEIQIIQFVLDNWLILLLVLVVACICIFIVTTVIYELLYWIKDRLTSLITRKKNTNLIPLTVTHLFSPDHPLGKTCDGVEYKTYIPVDELSLDELLLNDFFLDIEGLKPDTPNSDKIIAIDYRDDPEKPPRK